MRTYYKSDLDELKDKEFTDEEECRKAEAKVNAEIAKKQELANNRKKDAAVVSNYISKAIETKKEVKEAKMKAYEDFLTKLEELDKKLDEAEKEQYDALDEFCKKYPEGFHETIKIGDVNTRVDYTSNSLSLADIFKQTFRW